MTPEPGGILLYDGECGFCQESIRIFRRLAKRPVPAEPANLHSDHLSAADRARADREILFLGSDGSVLGGVDAIAAALRAADRPLLAWLLRHTPFADGIYAAIARRRRSLTCPAVRPRSPSPPCGPVPPGSARS